MKALFNGHAVAERWVGARALHYGDGVFRTTLVVDGEIVDLERHVAKLALDAQLLGLDPSDAVRCGKDAVRLGKGHKRGVIKLMLWRKAMERGYRPSTRVAERLVLRGDLPAVARAAWTRGVRAFRSPVVLSAQPRLAGLKHLNRLEQVLASSHWPRSVDEALLCDASGHPIGGTKSNLFWIARGRLYTPLLDACGVAGVMRQKVLEAAQRLGLAWRIGPYSWREFIDAEEAFLTNSLIGIWPLRRCGTRQWRAPGPATRRLIAALAHPWKGA